MKWYSILKGLTVAMSLLGFLQLMNDITLLPFESVQKKFIFPSDLSSRLEAHPASFALHST